MGGGGGGWVFISKNILVLDMQEKKNGSRGVLKNNMASKIVKKIFWTHMMEMIPFYLIFPNVVGFWVGEGDI